MSSPLDTVRLMVKSYPGGIPSIAPRLGTTAEVLRKELAGAQGHKLGLERALHIAELCREADTENQTALANLVAAEHGKLIRLPVVEMGAAGCIHTAMGHVVKELSDTTTATLNGNADGVISDNDLVAIEREIGEAYAALQRLQRVARQMHVNGQRDRG